MSVGYAIVIALVALTAVDAVIFLILMGAVMTRAIAEMTKTPWGDVAGGVVVALIAMALAWLALESPGCQQIPYSMGGTEGISFQDNGDGTYGTYEPKPTMDGRRADD